MATKNMAYDHPAYTSVHNDSFAIASGSGSQSVPKFIAYTSMIVKSVTLKPTTASTSADVASLIQISGTTTTTYGLGTTGSAATVFSNYLPGSAANLIQGDTYYVVKGTDATLVLAGVIETVVTPLANVTS
jgi:hypothetical protein